MNRSAYLAMAIPSSLALVTGAAIHAIVFRQSALHLLAWLALLGASALLSWNAAKRSRIAWAVPAILAFWGPLHGTGLVAYMLAVVSGAVLLLHRSSRWVHGAVGGALAGLGVALLGGPLIGWLVAVAGGALLASSRSEWPTGEWLDRLESGALAFPAMVLGGALMLNAVTGRADQTAVDALLGWMLALFGSLMLGTLGLLGMHTLLSSQDAGQRGAWTAVSAGVAMAAGAAFAKDPSRVLDAITVSAIPVAHLAAIFGERLTGRRRFPWALALPLSPVVLTLGL